MSDADDIEDLEEELTLPGRRARSTSAREEPDDSDDEFGTYDEEDFLVEEVVPEQDSLPKRRRLDVEDGYDDREEPVKKSRHKVHVVQNTKELATTYEYGTQAPEPDSSPTTFRGPRWKIPKAVITPKAATTRFVYQVLAFTMSCFVSLRCLQLPSPPTSSVMKRRIVQVAMTEGTFSYITGSCPDIEMMGRQCCKSRFEYMRCMLKTL